MSKQVVSTQEAPAAIGPYSQALKLDKFVFASGQIPLTPKGEIISGGIEAQTRQVISNLTAVLEAAGSSLDKVVKTTVFLKDLTDFAAFNQVYGEVFRDSPPARSTVQVSALPKDALVEIEAIAYI